METWAERLVEQETKSVGNNMDNNAQVPHVAFAS
ncbi:hypothetical protein LR68_00702 [Anoxybacillus sp. BCO1]|nr:hypothetical protein LR68_00702 [Anoxybacillus sp. BCO1]